MIEDHVAALGAEPFGLSMGMPAQAVGTELKEIEMCNYVAQGADTMMDMRQRGNMTEEEMKTSLRERAAKRKDVSAEHVRIALTETLALVDGVFEYPKLTGDKLAAAKTKFKADYKRGCFKRSANYKF